MANIGAYTEKLDWVWGGATPTRPTAWGVGLSLGVPTSVSGSDMTRGVGYASVVTLTLLSLWQPFRGFDPQIWSRRRALGRHCDFPSIL